MKKLLPWMSLLILFPLVACSAITGGTQPKAGPTSTVMSPAQLQTQISQSLTMLPTTTGAVQQAATATLPLPTVAIVTATTVNSATPTVAPSATTAVTSVPTVAITNVNTPAVTSTTGPTQPAGPTTTPVPGDPRTRLGNPTSTDPMDNATAWVWPTGSDQYSLADFSNGVQSVTALTGTDAWRMANPQGRAFSNLYLEATFRTGACSGSDHYGLIARVPVVNEPNQGYLFSFTCDGRYSLRRWNSLVAPKGEMKWLVDWKSSSDIVAGANQVNRMGVMTVGSRLILYANGKLLKEVQDNSFSSGYFGVLVGEDNTPNLTMQVDQMSYWENPQP